MYCKSCGKEIPDGVRFCTNCGADNGSGSFEDKAASAADMAVDAVRDAAQSVDSAVDELLGNNGQRPAGAPLKTDRSLAAYIILSLITLGIYGFFFVHSVAKDVNVACGEDGESTPGLGMYIILCILTCGFYGIWWEYKLGNRLQKKAPDYQLMIQENGTTIVLWRLLGSLLCGVGTFVGSYILIKNVNLICSGYNRRNGLV